MKNVKLIIPVLIVLSCFYISFTAREKRLETEKKDLEHQLSLEIEKKLKIVEKSVTHDIQFRHTSFMNNKHDTLVVYIDNQTISGLDIKHSQIRLLGKAIAESIKADTNKVTVVINSKQ